MLFSYSRLKAESGLVRCRLSTCMRKALRVLFVEHPATKREIINIIRWSFLILLFESESYRYVELHSYGLAFLLSRRPLGHCFYDSFGLFVKQRVYMSDNFYIADAAVFLNDEVNHDLSLYAFFLGFWGVFDVLSKVLHQFLHTTRILGHHFYDVVDLGFLLCLCLCCRETEYQCEHEHQGFHSCCHFDFHFVSSLWVYNSVVCHDVAKVVNSSFAVK